MTDYRPLRPPLRAPTRRTGGHQYVIPGVLVRPTPQEIRELVKTKLLDFSFRQAERDRKRQLENENNRERQQRFKQNKNKDANA